MKITDVRTEAVHVNDRGNWVFVLVETDAGICGVGEASHSGNDALLRHYLETVLKPGLVGQDARRIEALCRVPGGLRTGMLGMTALSAMEQALWDIVGKAAGLPTYQLLGGAVRERIRVYANINRATGDRSPEGFAASAAQALAEGFSDVKCAPFDDVQARTLDSVAGRLAFELGLARARAVRDAIGTDADLLVDCHQRFDEATAPRVVEALAPLRLFWIEAPGPRDTAATLLPFKHTLRTLAPGVRLAGGEDLLGRWQWAEPLERQALDVAMIDVKRVGGLLEGKKVASLAELHDVHIAPHSPAGPVATAAAVHLCATLPNFLILEHAWGEVSWRSELVGGAEVIASGHIPLPSGPGLGVALDEAALAAHRT